MAGDGFLSLQGHLRKFRYVEKVSRSYGCFWLVASSQGHLRELEQVGMVSLQKGGNSALGHIRELEYGGTQCFYYECFWLVTSRSPCLQMVTWNFRIGIW